jgi:hypothetical protein
MSVPPDIMAALMGGGGGPAPGGGGLPPDLMAALGGGGPQDQGPPSQPSQGGSDPHIRNAIDELNAAIQAEADDQDKQTIQTCIANLQGVLANNQKDADALMTGKANPRAMRKASAAQGGQ